MIFCDNPKDGFAYSSYRATTSDLPAAVVRRCYVFQIQNGEHFKDTDEGSSLIEREILYYNTAYFSKLNYTLYCTVTVAFYKKDTDNMC